MSNPTAPPWIGPVGGNASGSTIGFSPCRSGSDISYAAVDTTPDGQYVSSSPYVDCFTP
jgi:hypothetical protein